MDSQKTPHSSPSWASYVVSIGIFFIEYWLRYNGTALQMYSVFIAAFPLRASQHPAAFTTGRLFNAPGARMQQA